MASIFPEPREGDVDETRRVFMHWLEFQERDLSAEELGDSTRKEWLRREFRKTVHPDVVVHGVPVKGSGRDGWEEFLLGLAGVFRRGQSTYDFIVVEADVGSAHWTYRATYRPEADGPVVPIEVSGVMFDRIEDGMIVEHWAVIDQLSWMQQMGVIDDDVRM